MFRFASRLRGCALSFGLCLSAQSCATDSFATDSCVIDACVIERHAYAPAVNLETIDVELIGRATRTIDMAAYVLTSAPIVEALDSAAARGVRIRLYRDGRDARMPRRLAEPYNRLLDGRGFAPV